jgi:hypothetical protein
MSPREIIITALAGESAADEEDAQAVVGIAFEQAVADAFALAMEFEGQNDKYLRAINHTGRLRALGEFIERYLKVEFETEAANDGGAES